MYLLFSGVTSLRVLLAREKDEDSPKLNILLTECLFAVYVSLVINALATYDCFLLYRLTAHQFSTKLWSSLFGGGVKTVIRLGSTSPKLGSQYNLYMISYMKFWIKSLHDWLILFHQKIVLSALTVDIDSLRNLDLKEVALSVYSNNVVGRLW